MTTVSIDVERRADQVFAYATDPTKFSEWQGAVVSGSMRSNGAPAVGDHCRTTRRIGGAERPSTSELVRLTPPRAWSVHGIDGPIRAQVDLDVEPLAAERARITICDDFTGHGIGRLLVALVVRRPVRRHRAPATITPPVAVLHGPGNTPPSGHRDHGTKSYRALRQLDLSASAAAASSSGAADPRAPFARLGTA